MNLSLPRQLFKLVSGFVLVGTLLFLFVLLSGATRVSAVAPVAGFHWEYSFEFSLNGGEKLQDRMGALDAGLVGEGVQSAISPLGGTRYQMTISGSRDLEQVRQALYDVLLPGFNLFQEPWQVEILVPQAPSRPMTLKLESLPGTGFEWLPVDPDVSGFHQQGQSVFTDRYEAPGAPAVQTLVFEPLSSGAATLALAYRRPFGENQPANRLTAVTGGQSAASYAYDGLGNRLQQVVNGNTITYVNDLNAGLTQVLSDGTNTYTYGLERISQVGSTETEYFLGDALGSVRQLTDSTGAVTLAKNYDPFGNEVRSWGSASTIYGFTAEQTEFHRHGIPEGEELLSLYRTIPHQGYLAR